MKFMEMINEMTFVNDKGQTVEFKATHTKYKVKPDKHGFAFDVNYPSQILINGKKVMHPIYRLWNNMKQRTTSLIALNRNPQYIGCYVCQEWRTYSKFAAWIMRQPRWLDRELDKDILVSGNKEYSACYCRFVPHAINLLLTDRGNDRGEYPLGVSFDSVEQKHRTYCWVDGKHISCRFPNTYTGLMSAMEAIKASHAWWQQAKIHAIKVAIARYLDPEIDQDIITALEGRVAKLKHDVENGLETVKL